MKEELINIRKVKSSDARGWNILSNKLWKETYNHIFPEEVFKEKEKNIEEKIKSFALYIKNDNENIAYVAECNDEIIGVMCGKIKSSYEYFSKEYADLEAIYIDSKFQGRKIGTKFKQIFENWALKNGANKYVIGVLKDNTKARKVYEAWGGILSQYESDFVKLGVKYSEVFYTYDLENKTSENIGQE